jgi:hypothetical protein
VKDDDLDSGWDEPEPDPKAQSIDDPASAAPEGAPDPDALDSAWDDLPPPRAPRREKKRKRGGVPPPVTGAPVVRPQPASRAPSLAQARREAKKHRRGKRADRTLDKRSRREQKKRQQVERRAEGRVDTQGRPARNPKVSTRAERPPARQRSAPAIVLERRSDSAAPARPHARREREVTNTPARPKRGLPRRYLVLAVALALLVFAAVWLLSRGR